MKMKDAHKIIALSIAAGLLLWVLDALIDTFILGQQLLISRHGTEILFLRIC